MLKNKIIFLSLLLCHASIIYSSDKQISLRELLCCCCTSKPSHRLDVEIDQKPSIVAQNPNTFEIESKDSLDDSKRAAKSSSESSFETVSLKESNEQYSVEERYKVVGKRGEKKVSFEE